MEVFEVLKQILLTEKSNLLLSGQNTYTFIVDDRVNKNQVARAVERLFDVKVARVNVLNYVGKAKRVRSKTRNRYTLVGNKKKAMVLLKEGYKIDVA